MTQGYAVMGLLIIIIIITVIMVEIKHKLKSAFQSDENIQSDMYNV